MVKISYHNSIDGPFGWATWFDAGCGFGLYECAEELTEEKGNFVTVRFLGTGLRIIICDDPYCSDVLYYVDDTVTDISNGTAVADGSVDLGVAGAWTPGELRNVVSNLPFGWHTVSIQTTNAIGSGHWFEVDAFILDDAIGPIKNADISSGDVAPSDANLAVMAFQCIDIVNHYITSISITNPGTMQDTADISAVKLYYDVNADYNYDVGDVWIANGIFLAGKWDFTSLNIVSETNLIIIIDINPATVNYGRTFQGVISSGYVTCESNISNKNSITNSGVYTILPKQPKIGSLFASPDASVTNDNSDALTFVASITDKGDGVVPVMNLSPIGNSASTTLQPIGGNLYAISNITVPSIVAWGVVNVILYAYPTNFPSVYDTNSIDVNIASFDTISPNIPSGFTAIDYLNRGILNWTASTDETAFLGYKVYRGELPGVYNYTNFIGNVTSYTDIVPEWSKDYFYAVVGMDTSLNESSFSVEKMITVTNVLVLYDGENTNNFR